jgi:hypothetical protein
MLICWSHSLYTTSFFSIAFLYFSLNNTKSLSRKYKLIWAQTSSAIYYTYCQKLLVMEIYIYIFIYTYIFHTLVYTHECIYIYIHIYIHIKYKVKQSKVKFKIQKRRAWKVIRCKLKYKLILKDNKFFIAIFNKNILSILGCIS